MKQIIANKVITGLCLMVFSNAITGCAEKDLYDPNYKKGQLPPVSEYFGFETKSATKLNVNYDMPGYKALIEVYAENPIEESKTDNGIVRTKKEGVEAIFKTYTDDNCQFAGTLSMPISLKEVYLYSRDMALPECVKIEVVNGEINFDKSMTISNTATRATTRAYPFDNGVPYLINNNYHLYSICKWGDDGRLFNHVNGNNYTPINENYVALEKTVGNENLSALISRLKKILWNGANEKSPYLDNSKYVASAENTNLYISPKAADGSDIVDARIDVVFIHERAGYRNTFGYYYYKGTDPKDVSAIRKYVIFPNVSLTGDAPYDSNAKIRMTEAGSKVRLQFFGEDGNGQPQDAFPAGYSIGWLVVPDGYNVNDNEIQNLNAIRTSNDKDGKYITLYDQKSKKLVIGVEDGPDNSYEDLLFYVDADPMKAIVNPEEPGRPTIPEGGGSEDVVIPDVTETTSGTLAFEDLWPYRGDYDMNDVVVEYRREVTFDKNNKVKKIVDTFKPVNDGAISNINTFAYQLDASQMGALTLPIGAEKEAATNSIILFTNSKQLVESKQVYVVTREFDEAATFDKKDLKAYNPYIIVNYTAGVENRIEVHLPKFPATSLANQRLSYTQNDAYYVDKDGKYPFAIDIPIVNFKIVTEMGHIDDAKEYPDFATWVESKGTLNQNWYLRYNGGK